MSSITIYIIDCTSKETNYAHSIQNIKKQIHNMVLKCFLINLLNLQDNTVKRQADNNMKLNINKNPTRCNSRQSDLFYCKVTLHVSGAHSTHHQVPTCPCWREVAVPILWRVPEAVDTVFSTDDGWCGRPKRAEWLCSKINQTAYCCILRC